MVTACQLPFMQPASDTCACLQLDFAAFVRALIRIESRMTQCKNGSAGISTLLNVIDRHWHTNSSACPWPHESSPAGWDQPQAVTQLLEAAMRAEAHLVVSWLCLLANAEACCSPPTPSACSASRARQQQCSTH